MTNAPPNRFLWLYDRITETEMSGMQIAVMFVLLARDEAGLRAITKSEIGALVGVSDRQVTTVLTQLERDLSLIQTQRHGGTGKGRVANSYLVRPDANGSAIPVAWGNKKSSSGMPLPVTESNQQSSSGSELPVAGNVPEISGSASGSAVPSACGEILPPIEHAPARGEDNLKLRDITQLYPERAELAATAARVRLNGSAKGMHAFELMSHLIRIVDSPSLDARSAGLAKTCHELKNLIDDGADFDADIVPTVIELCARKNGEPIKSMAYFSAAIRANAATRLRLEQQARNPITPAEAKTHDSTSSTSVDGIRVRREPVSPATAARLQRRARREAERQPIDFGRVDSQRID